MINIVEILKDCPKGTKLYSPICGECRLIKIYDGLGFDVINDTDAVFNFSYDGRYHLNGECCIFPSKENRDWNTFHPWTIQDAKDGDVIFYDDGWTCIFKRIHGIWYSSYCFITSDGEFYTAYERHAVDSTINGNAHPATKEQCNLLFQKMKEAGYKWNAETKTLEKIIVPKFKAGDKIKEKNERFPSTRTIGNYTEGIGYFTTINDWVRIEDQDNWELVPNKFDISTLQPFDKVMVRNDISCVWKCNLYSHYSQYPYHYICVDTGYKQCIPYEGNEHLLGTNNECDEYYKNW